MSIKAQQVVSSLAAMKQWLMALEDGDYWEKKDAIASLRKAIQEEALRNVQRLGQEIQKEEISEIKNEIKPNADGTYTITDKHSTADIVRWLITQDSKETVLYLLGEAEKHEVSQEPVAHMYPDDLEKFKTDETFAYAYSIEMGSPTKGETVPLYDRPQPTEERNFCPRCGKRTNDIHTCTPPKGEA